MRKLTVTLLVVSIVSGCASMGRTEIRPKIDTKNLPQSGEQMEKDIKECNAYADEEMGVAEGAMEGGVMGAGLGALVGAVIGAAVGVDVGSTAAWGAGAGATQGAVSGGVNADKNKRDIVARCLDGRGYNVLSW